MLLEAQGWRHLNRNWKWITVLAITSSAATVVSHNPPHTQELWVTVSMHAVNPASNGTQHYAKNFCSRLNAESLLKQSNKLHVALINLTVKKFQTLLYIVIVQRMTHSYINCKSFMFPKKYILCRHQNMQQFTMQTHKCNEQKG